MRLRVVSLFLPCLAVAAAWSCGLNPQPIPPDGYDASADGSIAAFPDASGSDAGASIDGTTPQGGDASATDAGDAGDASDARDDAADARDDADDGAALDAGEDG